jgi:hypothetical protein
MDPVLPEMAIQYQALFIPTTNDTIFDEAAKAEVSEAMARALEQLFPMPPGRTCGLFVNRLYQRSLSASVSDM